MAKTLEETAKGNSNALKIPKELRPFGVGYRIVNSNGNVYALKNGASVFALPSEARKAIQKEYVKNDPEFDVFDLGVEEVAVLDYEKFKNYLWGLSK